VSDAPYEIAHLDDLERLPVDDEGLVWRPIRRRFGISAFGTNAYTAAKAGDRVVEEHHERDGHEELYFVAAGRARFTLGDDELDAPAGTLVFARPGTRRGAVAEEAGTTVFAIGAKPGVVFEPSQWEDWFAAGGYRRLGRSDEGRRILRASVEANPDGWQGYYNLACYEALDGRRDDAIAALQRAAELAPEEAAKYAADDSDFDSIRDDPRFPHPAG
jgi:tetratricopeptide (TPR) repeat protein